MAFHFRRRPLATRWRDGDLRRSSAEYEGWGLRES
ncbi:hypothetical protein ERO13_D02G026350v2 [Gossypium hirsutum]|nr:hypothetical protein ERO13_D02G026350v2 [Gossypium hirsutum]